MTQQQSSGKLTWQEVPKDQVASILGGLTVDTSEAQSPLRDFEGDLFDYKVSNAESRQDDGTLRQLTKVEFMFRNMKVTKSVTPYPYQTGSLTFTHSTSGNSAWGMFVAGARDILGAGTPLPKLLNRRYHVEYTGGHVRRQQNRETGKWEDTTTEAFEIVSIDGVQRPKAPGQTAPHTATGTLTTVATQAPPAQPQVNPAQDIDSVLIDAMNGKNENQALVDIFELPSVRGNPQLFNELITNPTPRFQKLIQSGKLKLENGVYHKV